MEFIQWYANEAAVYRNQQHFTILGGITTGPTPCLTQDTHGRLNKDVVANVLVRVTTPKTLLTKKKLAQAKSSPKRPASLNVAT